MMEIGGGLGRPRGFRGVRIQKGVRQGGGDRQEEAWHRGQGEGTSRLPEGVR